MKRVCAIDDYREQRNSQAPDNKEQSEVLVPESVFTAWFWHGVNLWLQGRRRGFGINHLESVLREAVGNAIAKAYQDGYRQGKLSGMPNLVGMRRAV